MSQFTSESGNPKLESNLGNGGDGYFGARAILEIRACSPLV
ncbi:MAG: hypothetical protein ACJ8NS_06425 [Chthoniobacterales bacterium]